MRGHAKRTTVNTNARETKHVANQRLLFAVRCQTKSEKKIQGKYPSTVPQRRKRQVKAKNAVIKTNEPRLELTPRESHSLVAALQDALHLAHVQDRLALYRGLVLDAV